MPNFSNISSKVRAKAQDLATWARAGREAPTQQGRAARAAAGQPTHSSFDEQLVMGVPARIMRPRLVFMVCLAAICLFGLLMVYSASSVEALKEHDSSTYFLVRQFAFMLIGLAAFWGILKAQIGVFESNFVWIIWGVVLIMLVLVAVIGGAGGGAQRWIYIGSFSLQPSEFAKPALIILMAKLFDDLYEKRSITTDQFAIRAGLAIATSVVLILLQPDFGTSVIILLTLALMACYAGIQRKTIWAMVFFILALAVGAVVIAPYRIARLIVASDPWADPYNTGFQATYAIMAFASGGLFGRGIGNATIKYNYLPEAHNDYILAIIGEELGFFGTVAFLAVFGLMLYSAFLIARRAPTKFWSLVAAGSATVLMVQYFINILGILNVIPMTGKPLPFVSYGGSSVLTSLILAGLIVRASYESNRASVYDQARSSFSVVGAGSRARAGRGAAGGAYGAGAAAGGYGAGRGYDAAEDVSAHLGRSTAGEAHVRGQRSSTGRVDALDAIASARNATLPNGTRGGETSRYGVNAGGASSRVPTYGRNTSSASRAGFSVLDGTGPIYRGPQRGQGVSDSSARNSSRRADGTASPSGYTSNGGTRGSSRAQGRYPGRSDGTSSRSRRRRDGNNGNERS